MVSLHPHPSSATGTSHPEKKARPAPRSFRGATRAPSQGLPFRSILSDFRDENGATLVVPGSHRWEPDRIPSPDEIIPAEMPAGSTLLWLGGTLHGAGANRSQDWRYGIILTYSLGWLRQEENQYLDVPVDLAAGLSPELRQIIGYEMYDALGIYDPSITSRAKKPAVKTRSYRDSA